MNCPTIIQECAAQKLEWLAQIRCIHPVGSEVVITQHPPGGYDNDDDNFIGRNGTVLGYDLGGFGSWPLIRVAIRVRWFVQEHGLYRDQLTQGK